MVDDWALSTTAAQPIARPSTCPAISCAAPLKSGVKDNCRILEKVSMLREGEYDDVPSPRVLAKRRISAKKPQRIAQPHTAKSAALYSTYTAESTARMQRPLQPFRRALSRPKSNAL